MISSRPSPLKVKLADCAPIRTPWNVESTALDFRASGKPSSAAREKSLLVHDI
jgi:hypothetical protein